MIRGAPPSGEDHSLFARAAAWREPEDHFAALNITRLAAIADSHGRDFATALVYDRALRVPANAAFAAHVARAQASRISPPELVAIVPGAFYREHRDTGADGEQVRQIARAQGWTVERIDLPSFGRVEDNARLIVDWLARRTERRIVLVSLSKGGSDVKRALAHPRADTAFAHVTAWVSFSGIVQGTPLIAWLRARPWRWMGVHLLLWLRRQPARTLGDLRHGMGGLLGPWPTLPPHLRVVHVCATPLQRHLQHPWAPRAYHRLAGCGPNDGGGIMLGDLSQLPGIVFPVWGADHYLAPSWDATALFRDVIIAALAPNFPDQASQSASTPTAAPATRSSA